MRRIRLSLNVLFMCGIASACSMTVIPQNIWQNAPAISLNNGQYLGLTSVREIKYFGNHGVGAWDQLDGEGVIVNGRFYKIHASGKVEEMPDSATMAWAVVTQFATESTVTLTQQGSYAQLQANIDPTFPTLNTHYAIKIIGEFTHLTTRSLPRQKPPFPPLCQVIPSQPEFHFASIRGTMVGFRSPDYVGNFGVPGWHLHFISDDKMHGGHVLDFADVTGELAIDRVDQLHIEMPDNPAFNQIDLNSSAQCE